MARLLIPDHDEVAIGVGDGEGVLRLQLCDLLLMQKAGGLGEIGATQSESRLWPKRGDGGDLNLLPGVAGHVQNMGSPAIDLKESWLR